MHQAGRNREAGKPNLASALRAREIGRDPIPRKALWPAADVCRINSRTHGRTDQLCRTIQIPLAKGEPFSNRASLVKLIFVHQAAGPGVTVLFAVSISCRMIWFEASVLQCPQRTR